MEHSVRDLIDPNRPADHFLSLNRFGEALAFVKSSTKEAARINRR
jgi:hypothetical protein